MNEVEINNIRKRLIWRANHRGTKEVDILLGSFAEMHVPKMDAEVLASFESFMEIADPQMQLIMTHEADLPAGMNPKLNQMLSNFQYQPMPKSA